MNSCDLSGLRLPINARYDTPALNALRHWLGYENYYQPAIRVEIANLEVLHGIGVIGDDEFNHLTPEKRAALLEIPTSVVDEFEKQTHHDIRALIKAMQQILGQDLGRWLHVPLTSYDTLSTAMSLLFRELHFQVIGPRIKTLIGLWAKQVEKYADVVQIGRTHLQHAMPVTIGFWLATILDRVVYCLKQADHFAAGLKGKISGAVGAYNAQVHLGIAERCGAISYEQRVLQKLGLEPYPISTQIAPPEPLAFYLFSLSLLSAAFLQLAEDARNLIRPEINELIYPVAPGQDGSSTMAQKINPILLENICGGFVITKNIFGMVLDTLQSDFQRDLRWTSVMRDFGAIPTKLMHQVETLLKVDKESGLTLIERLSVNPTGLAKNLSLAGDSVLAEPMYISLILAGYRDEAHSVIRDATRSFYYQTHGGLWDAVAELAQERGDSELIQALGLIPEEVKELFLRPEEYVGFAPRKAREIALNARMYVA